MDVILTELGEWHVESDWTEALLHVIYSGWKQGFPSHLGSTLTPYGKLKEQSQGCVISFPPHYTTLELKLELPESERPLHLCMYVVL